MSDTELRQAIELALNDQWDAAHRIVQDIESPTAAWIHAVLHKMEGDKENAAYWYQKAQMVYVDTDPRPELQHIMTTLGGGRG